MDLSAKIYVAGHRGMVGSAVVRHLRTLGYHNIITRSSQELDLTQQQAVQDFMQCEQPDVAVIAAAKVGGIHANNTYPAEFIYQNLARISLLFIYVNLPAFFRFVYFQLPRSRRANSLMTLFSLVNRN